MKNKIKKISIIAVGVFAINILTFACTEDKDSEAAPVAKTTVKKSIDDSKINASVDQAEAHPKRK